MMAVQKIVFGGLLLGVATLVYAAEPGMPGTVNYVEGQATLEGQALTTQSVGETTMKPGEVLTTGQGRAEILLTPGVFLRLDNDSAVKMVSPDLTLTQMELEHGRASVEVDEIHKENDLEIVANGITTQLVKTGYYQFGTTPGQAMVFNGMAAVEVNDGKYTVVKSHRMFDLQQGSSADQLEREKPQGFYASDEKDDFFNWNSLRSKYLAEANNQLAGQMNGTPGWYWDPGIWSYTYMGMDPFMSPFGFGFYPFGWGGWGGWGGMYMPMFGYGGGYSTPFHGGGGMGHVAMGGGFHGGGGGHR